MKVLTNKELTSKYGVNLEELHLEAYPMAENGMSESEVKELHLIKLHENTMIFNYDKNQVTVNMESSEDNRLYMSALYELGC